MAIKNEYVLKVDRFSGIDQSHEENLLPVHCACMAENMDTTAGNLSVASGFVRQFDEPVPGEKRITRLMHFFDGDSEHFVIAAGNELYAHKDGEWKLIKTFENIQNDRWDYVQARLNGKNVLIIANGEYPPVKYDGESVSELGTNLPKVNYLTIHGERLFASGEKENPNRVYFSKDYDLGDWGTASTPASGGGTIEIQPTSGDAITGIFAVFNTVLVLKCESAYYISGVTPAEYHVRRAFGKMAPVAPLAVTSHAETAYMLSPDGLIVYNGISLQPHKHADRVRGILGRADLTRTKAVEHANKLYFTLKYPRTEEDGTENALLVYDVMYGTYMLRTGFSVADLVSAGGKLYLVGDKRYVYRWGDGRSYDGEPINAYWELPGSDMMAKNVIKTSLTLYARATGETGSQLVLRHTFSDPRERSRVDKRLLPQTPRIIRPIITNYGRRVKLRVENEGGKWFALMGGMELSFELEED